MSADRSVRKLSALSSASSSRVLNLIAIAEANAENDRHRDEPLFVSRAFNHSLILKHRLRPSETDLFAIRRAVGTKVIIPFERHNLNAGGHSLFVGQRGFEEMVREVGNYRDEEDLARDLTVMRMIDALPSLDPFLLREHLRCSEIHADGCYFAISESDQKRMHDFASAEVGRLAVIANGSKKYRVINRMAGAFLSQAVDDKLEPLRGALGLKPAEFSEGVFSWRGFVYYKWCLEETWPQLIRALKGITAISPVGKMSCEERAFLEACKNSILRGAKACSEEIRAVIGVYDKAYASLVEGRDPKRFRDFLLDAPQLFLDIGDRMGAITHITGLWNYGFPMGAPRTVDAEELIAIFQDFASCLNRGTGGPPEPYLDQDTARRLEATTAPMTMIQDGSSANTRSAKLVAASAASRQLAMALVQSGE
jgi:hypothetical protein